MRNMCRVSPSHDLARRSRCVLRLGRAARRSSLARQPVIVGGGVVLRASYEAKAHGVRTAMGGAQARGCAHERSSSRRACRLTARRARRVRGVPRSVAVRRGDLDRRGIPRRARLERIAGTPVEIAVAVNATDVRTRSVFRSPSVLARTKFLAKVASGVAKPDGLARRGARPRAGLPSSAGRWNGCGVLGAVTARKLHEHEIVTVGDVARVDEGTLVARRSRFQDVSSTRVAHNRDARPVEARRRRLRFARSAALGRSARGHE